MGINIHFIYGILCLCVCVCVYLCVSMSQCVYVYAFYDTWKICIFVFLCNLFYMLVDVDVFLWLCMFICEFEHLEIFNLSSG